jgi:hypothetical protein
MASAIIPSWSSVQAVDHARVICSSSDSMGRDSGPLAMSVVANTLHPVILCDAVCCDQKRTWVTWVGEGYVTVNVGWYPGACRWRWSAKRTSSQT